MVAVTFYLVSLSLLGSIAPAFGNQVTNAQGNAQTAPERKIVNAIDDTVRIGTTRCLSGPNQCRNLAAAAVQRHITENMPENEPQYVVLSEDARCISTVEADGESSDLAFGGVAIQTCLTGDDYRPVQRHEIEEGLRKIQQGCAETSNGFGEYFNFQTGLMTRIIGVSPPDQVESDAAPSGFEGLDIEYPLEEEHELVLESGVLESQKVLFPKH